MLKKKIMAVIMGAAMIMSQAVSLVTVNAAEESTAPWSFYTVSASTWDDVSTWNKVTGKRDFNDTHTFYNEGREGTAPVIRMKSNGMQIVPASDSEAKGTTGNVNMSDNSLDINTNRGSLIVAFTVPYSGDWNIDALCTNSEDDSGNSGVMEFSCISNGANIDIQEVTIPAGKGSTAEFEKELELLKGEVIALKLKSSSSYKRSFYFNYVISDANNPSVSFDVLDGAKYVSVNNETVFNPALNAEIDNKDAIDSAWQILYTYDVDNENYKTISNFVLPTPKTGVEENGNRKFSSDPLNSSSANFQSWVFFTKAYPLGGVRVSANGAAKSTDSTSEAYYRFNNVKYNPVIRWTAPVSGEYIIKLKGRNLGTDVTTGEKTNHRLASSSGDDAEVTILDSFQIEGSTSKGITEKTWMYSVEKDECIYLINDAGNDSHGDALLIDYVIENMATGEVWDLGNYYSQRLSNYNFSFFTAATGDDKAVTFKRNAFSESDGNIISKYESSSVTIKPDGTMNLSPVKGKKNIIGFDVPETGFYKIELIAQNDGEGSETGTNILVKRHTDWGGLTYNPSLSAAEEIGNITLAETGDKKEVSKIISLEADDRIWLINSPVSEVTGLDINVGYTITKVENFDVTYKANGSVVYKASEIEAGATVTADVAYISDTAMASATVVMAAYDAEGKMIDVDMEDTSFAANTAETTPLSITLPTGISAKNVKVFIIESMDTMIPVTGAIELK